MLFACKLAHYCIQYTSKNWELTVECMIYIGRFTLARATENFCLPCAGGTEFFRRTLFSRDHVIPRNWVPVLNFRSRMFARAGRPEMTHTVKNACSAMHAWNAK